MSRANSEWRFGQVFAAIVSGAVVLEHDSLSAGWTVFYVLLLLIDIRCELKARDD